MLYTFCSMCGGKLKKKGAHLACAKCPFVNYRNPRPTTGAFVISGEKILLTKRGRSPFRGWWDLPGGFVDGGEHPDAAVVRELKEETGLSVKVERLLGVYPGTYPDAFDPFRILNFVYVVTANATGAGAFDDVVESRWFDIRSMPKKIAFDSQQAAIQDFKKLYQHLWK